LGEKCFLPFARRYPQANLALLLDEQTTKAVISDKLNLQSYLLKK